MLSETPEGLKGLKALFEAYEAHYGLEPLALARKYNYKISVRRIPLSDGKLNYGESIVVSNEGPALLRDFIIFHEMAHHFLCPNAPIFSSTDFIPATEADDIEYWCDHFGVAMFLAQRGGRIMGEESYIPFLTCGNDAAYDGRDSIRPWRQSKVLAGRIPGMARLFFKRNEVPFKECLVLQQGLLMTSKLIELREHL
jgi:hypothetical protein